MYGAWRDGCSYMEQPNSSGQIKSQKPYDIRERAFLFVCDVIRAAQKANSKRAGCVCVSFGQPATWTRSTTRSFAKRTSW